MPKQTNINLAKSKLFAEMKEMTNESTKGINRNGWKTNEIDN